jgi:hypothetical protein
MGGLRSRSGRFCEQKNLFPLPGIYNHYCLIVQPRRRVTLPNERSMLRAESINVKLFCKRGSVLQMQRAY